MPDSLIRKDSSHDVTPRMTDYQAAVRREGHDITIITYGINLFKCLEAAELLSAESISAEVIDLRVLRPLDTKTFVESVQKTHRALIVDDGWKTGSISAEIGMQIVEHAFFALDAPIARVARREVPMPYAKHMEEAALPKVSEIVDAARRLVKPHV